MAFISSEDRMSLLKLHMKLNTCRACKGTGKVWTVTNGYVGVRCEDCKGKGSHHKDGAIKTYVFEDEDGKGG